VYERAEQHVQFAVRAEGHPLAAAYYETTTCVPDRVPAAAPAGNHHHSTERGSDRRDELLRSSLVDRKKEQNIFCCVTTRSQAPHPRLPMAKLARPFDGLLPDGAPAVAAPRLHGPAAPRDRLAAVVAAWPPANAAPVSGIPDPGSSVGSNGAAGSGDRTLGGDKYGAAGDCD
jgi:hypothetical protein